MSLFYLIKMLFLSLEAAFLLLHRLSGRLPAGVSPSVFFCVIYSRIQIKASKKVRFLQVWVCGEYR